MRDFSLYSGERQVGATLSEIRRDHVARYELAIDDLKKRKCKIIADCFCGNGYGTSYISKSIKNSRVLGLDASKEAIEFADRHYDNERTFFINKYFPFELPHNTFDAVVSFESLEHVKNGMEMYKMLVSALKPGGVLWFSVPNEKINSLKINNHKFHVKHYTNEEIMLNFMDNMTKKKMYGQDVYVFRNGVQSELLPADKMEVKENYEGQVLIYCFEKNKKCNNFFKKILF